MREVTFESAETMVKQGETMQHCYLIMSGKVSTKYSLPPSLSCSVCALTLQRAACKSDDFAKIVEC